MITQKTKSRLITTMAAMMANENMIMCMVNPSGRGRLHRQGLAAENAKLITRIGISAALRASSDVLDHLYAAVHAELVVGLDRLPALGALL